MVGLEGLAQVYDGSARRGGMWAGIEMGKRAGLPRFDKGAGEGLVAGRMPALPEFRLCGGREGRDGS